MPLRLCRGLIFIRGQEPGRSAADLLRRWVHHPRRGGEHARPFARRRLAAGGHRQWPVRRDRLLRPVALASPDRTAAAMSTAVDRAGGRRSARTRVVVLGGGFGGVYTALHLERLFAKGAPVEVSLVNRENYLVFQPMLAEVIAGDVGILDTVSPLRQLLATNGPVRARDRGGRSRSAGGDAGSRAHAADAGAAVRPPRHRARQRHRLPGRTRASPSTRCRSRRSPTPCASATTSSTCSSSPRSCATRICAGRCSRSWWPGGGFSGTEVAAALNEFVRRAVRDYRSIPPERGPRRARAQRRERARARAHAADWPSYATAALAEQGIELAARRASRGGQPAERRALGRPAHLDAHADLDRAVLAQPGRRAAGPAHRAGATWSATPRWRSRAPTACGRSATAR